MEDVLKNKAQQKSKPNQKNKANQKIQHESKNTSTTKIFPPPRARACYIGSFAAPRHTFHVTRDA